MNQKESHYLNISTATFLRFFAIIIALAAVYYISDIIFSLIFAVIVASAIEPAIRWLQKRKVPRILGALLIYIGLAAFAAFIIYLIFPLVAEELQTVSTTFPALQSQFLTEIEHLGFFSLTPFLSDNADLFFRIPTEFAGKISGGVVNFAAGIFGGIFSFALIIVFSFYLAAQERGIESFLRLVTPLDQEPYVLDLWTRAQKKLGRWLQTQILLGAIVGFFIFFGLTMLGVRYALLFALLSAVFEIIPVVGPILAAVPAVSAAFLASPLLGISTAILFVAVQQMESHIIVPVVMRKAIGLSPLIVVLALLVGGKLGGIFGILLAVPLTAIGAEFLDDWDKKKRALMPE
ncbi:MAG: hypothetical protein G01um101433_419 [Parcubacteria group bacterium Gr01-1014_33]|nr:MAG: hypothetical protein G01um101433_419 [Parcubacteria group bacterium Gr01-1014_33]